MDLIY